MSYRGDVATKFDRTSPVGSQIVGSPSLQRWKSPCSGVILLSPASAQPQPAHAGASSSGKDRASAPRRSIHAISVSLNPLYDTETYTIIVVGTLKIAALSWECAPKRCAPSRLATRRQRAAKRRRRHRMGSSAPRSHCVSGSASIRRRRRSWCRTTAGSGPFGEHRQQDLPRGAQLAEPDENQPDHFLDAQVRIESQTDARCSRSAR